MKYQDVPGVVELQSTAGKFGTTLITGIIVLIVSGTIIIVVSKVIKEKRRQHEELERTLNTPINQNNDNNTNITT